MTNIQRIIADPHYRGFRIWHSLVTVLIFASCITLSLETLQEIAIEFEDAFFFVEWLSVTIFTLDYLGNLLYSGKGIRYAWSFWGIIDLVSIAPSYLMLFNLTALQGGKVLRLLRVARVLRVLKLARIAVEQAEQGKGANPIVTNLKIYLIIFFSVLMLSSTSMYFIEGGLYTPEAIAHGQLELDRHAPPQDMNRSSSFLLIRLAEAPSPKTSGSTPPFRPRCGGAL
jgi:hypothetical protein